MTYTRAGITAGNCLRRFASDRGGNVLMLFAFAAIPMLGLAAAAIDYTRASNARTQMQAALDSAVLAVAKQAGTLNDDTKILTETQKYFNAMFKNNDVPTPTLTVSYTKTNGLRVSATASSTINTTLARLLGVKQLPIGTASSATWGNTRMRIALVLDNTGSMDSAGKMTALKSATNNMLDQLKVAAADKEAIYVSVIPFSQPVNVDKSNVNASWIRWDLWDAANGETSGVCSSTSYTNKTDCLKKKKTWTISHDNWNGCVTDRDQDYDTNATAPAAGTSSTLFPADPQTKYCPVPLMAQTNLSTGVDTLKAKVTAMVPIGGTNQTIGLQWGMQSLIGTSPLAIPAKDPSYDYMNVIILLSDGLNTINRFGGDGSNVSPQVDARMAKACAEAKTRKIEVYTIQVNTGGDATSTVLKNCASSPGNFQIVTNSSAIMSSFQDIIGKLVALHLEK